MTPPTVDEVLEYLLQRVYELETIVNQLKTPQLMYKRPGSTTYEKIAEYLDDVDTRLKKLEE